MAATGKVLPTGDQKAAPTISSTASVLAAKYKARLSEAGPANKKSTHESLNDKVNAAISSFLYKLSPSNPELDDTDADADPVVALYTLFRIQQYLNPKIPKLVGSLFETDFICKPETFNEHSSARAKLTRPDYWNKFQAYADISPCSTIAAFLGTIDLRAGAVFKNNLKIGLELTGLKLTEKEFNTLFEKEDEVCLELFYVERGAPSRVMERIKQIEQLEGSDTVKRRTLTLCARYLLQVQVVDQKHKNSTDIAFAEAYIQKAINSKSWWGYQKYAAQLDEILVKANAHPFKTVLAPHKQKVPDEVMAALFNFMTYDPSNYKKGIKESFDLSDNVQTALFHSQNAMLGTLRRIPIPQKDEKGHVITGRTIWSVAPAVRIHPSYDELTNHLDYKL